MKPLALLTLLTMTTTLLAQPETGASLAWTSDDAVITETRNLVTKGELAKALAHLDKFNGDQRVVDEMRDIIRRIRFDYSLSADALIEKLRPHIRDLSASDILKWAEDGALQYRMLDGVPAYFKREPSNLFRFSEEAKSRRIEKPEKPNPFVLTQHLAHVIDQAKRTGKPEVLPVRHTITFTLAIPGNQAIIKEGALVRAWLPYAHEYRQQSKVTLISTSPGKPVIAENGSAHRTLYFEHRVTDPTKPIKFSAVFGYTSAAYYPILDDAKARPLPPDFDQQFLSDRPPHIWFSPSLTRTVKTVVGDETNPLAKARKIFNWIDANIRYNAEEEYAIIPSFSEHALARKRGDCGIQGTLFITMCRAAGVPARWQSGWQTKPNSWNMHDWAEFYVEPWGWLPADPSYGLQKSDDPAIRDFYFGHQDSYRLITNLDYGHELSPKKKSLRSEPADFQRGEVEVDGKNLYYDQFIHNFSFTSGPVEK